VLASAQLRRLWERELAAMRDRIRRMRGQLVQGLKAAGVRQNMDFIATQTGMFSYSGLSQTQMQRLRDDVDRSTALLEKLLQLARLDPQSGDSLTVESVDLQALIEDVVQTCAPLNRARQISLEMDCQVATLSVHREALVSALRNLVDNAIRYGRQGGRVRISVARSGERAVVIRVQDDGDGVSAEDRRQLSRRFFRVLGSGVPGSGLGLSIVARVAQLHGGTLTFGPGLDGRGLGATMTLPIQASKRCSVSLHIRSL